MRIHDLRSIGTPATALSLVFVALVGCSAYSPFFSLISRSTYPACVLHKCAHSMHDPFVSSANENSAALLAATRPSGVAPNSQKSSMERVLGQPQLLWFLLVISTLAAIGWKSLRFKSTSISAASWLFAAVAFAGAAGHTLFVAAETGKAWEPIFDTTTLLWLTAAILGLLFPEIYPRINEFSVAGANFKLATIKAEAARAEADVRSNDAKEVVLDSFSLIQAWTKKLNYALCDFPQKAEEQLRIDIICFLAFRAADVIKWIGIDNEVRRLAYWLREGDKLELAFSNEITRASSVKFWEYRFDKGMGIAGKALTSGHCERSR